MKRRRAFWRVRVRLVGHATASCGGSRGSTGDGCSLGGGRGGLLGGGGRRRRRCISGLSARPLGSLWLWCSVPECLHPPLEDGEPWSWVGTQFGWVGRYRGVIDNGLGSPAVRHCAPSRFLTGLGSGGGESVSDSMRALALEAVPFSSWVQTVMYRDGELFRRTECIVRRCGRPRRDAPGETTGH